MKVLLIIATILFGIKIYLDFNNDNLRDSFLEKVQYSTENKNKDVLSQNSLSDKQAAKNLAKARESRDLLEKDFLKKDQDQSRKVLKEAARELENLSRKETNKTPPRPRLNEKGEVNYDPTEMPF